MVKKAKRMISGLLAMITAVNMSCFIQVENVSASSELLRSTFEGNNDGWTARGNATVEYTDKTAYEGGYSLYVSGRTASWNGAMIGLGADFKAGKSYDFSGAVMYDTGEATEEISMTMQYNNASGEVIYDHLATVSVEKNKWTTVLAENYTVPSGATDIILYFETPKSTIDFYIDEVVAYGKKSQSVTPTKRGPGDINGDGYINIVDLIYLKQGIMGELSFADFSYYADLDGNKIISSADMTYMVKYLFGQISEFPATSMPGNEPPVDDNYDDSYSENLDAKTLKMCQDSLYRVGNTKRLLDKIQKAKSGENVTVGYIGGSITEGSNAGAQLCYAKLSHQYFADTFGTGSNVGYVNAGLSGTSSVLGVLRAKRDLLSKSPDVIFVEYSVNDQGSLPYQKSFESLVKKCLMQENEPAVIVLVTRSQSGGSCQPQMVAVAENYDLGVISVDNAVSNALKTGVMTWGDYASDQYHPHKEGHKLVAEFIGYYYRQAQLSKNRSTSYEIPSTVVYGDEYATAEMVSVSELKDFNAGSFKSGTSISSFRDGWTHSKNGNTPMTFSVEGRGIFLMFKSNQTASMGTAIVDVNGKQSKVSSNKLYTWGGPDADLAYIQDKSETLNVSISLESVSSDFELLGIGVIR